MAWADRLRAARNFYAISQESMAAKLGVNYRTYQGYEIGVSRPKAEIIETMVFLGFSPTWLLTGKGAMRGEANRWPLHLGVIPPLDESLLGRITEGISQAYAEADEVIGAFELGCQAARMMNDLMVAYPDPDDRVTGLVALLTVLRRELRTPVGIDSFINQSAQA